jgi:hypothetical protein
MFSLFSLIRFLFLSCVKITNIVKVTTVDKLLQDSIESYRISTEFYKSYKLLQNLTEFYRVLRIVITIVDKYKTYILLS